ncbi:MAG TPA: ABC transporter substrate-binding protein [Lachnospiraceae bacterium]|nr:ABC transporter substrate-binding protein [Lachnospiraceae bacterium]HBY71331.1 ABC transporter substrate-binding protein [Lachnospiraceae bacterium]HCM11584.1 ABC transporter substrate-binding protein [Lachnospiraceae bacterium]
MKKSLVTLITLMLALTLVMSLAIGCKKDEKPADSGKTTNMEPQEKDKAKDGEENTKEGSYADYSGGFPENVTIQIPVYDRAFENWDVKDNYYTKWIQSEFGDKYNITVEFIAIGRSTEVQDYTQMLAAGTAPDIIFHYDMPQALAYYNEGATQELDLKEIEYYAPDYYSKMKSTIEQYGAVDGAYHFFFGERPEAYNWVTLIRQDWIDAVGKTMPQNLTEFNELLAAWKEAGLGNGGGNLVMNNFTYDYPFRSWPIDKDERALYSDLSVAAFTWQPTYDYLKNLNYQYNHGLIDSEFYLNTDDATTQSDFVSGSSGVYSCYLSKNSTVIDNLLINNPDAKVSILDPKAGVPEGKVPQSRGYWPFGMIMGINHSTSPEERAAVWMYLNWMIQPENLFYLQNGPEGETYTTSDVGLAVPVPGYTGNAKLSNNMNKDYWCLVVESAQYEDPQLNYQANLNNWAPEGYEYLIEDSYNYFNDYREYMTPDALFSVVIESVANNKAELNDLWQELYVKCVMASEADFDKVYQECSQEYLDAGYQDILDEKKEAIGKGLFN